MTPNMIEVDLAAEHYRDAMRRGFDAGRREEFELLLKLLKSHGHYDAVLTLKKHHKAVPLLPTTSKGR